MGPEPAAAPGIPGNDDEPAGAPPRAGADGRRRWQPLAVGAAIVVVAAGVGVALVGAGGSDERRDATDAESAEPTNEQPPTTSVAELAPDEAFAQASSRLEAAGTFAYSGASLATDVNEARPGVWLAVELTVAGEVDLRSSTFHEIGTVPSGRVTETVTDGHIVWGRLADSEEDLENGDFLTIGDPQEVPVRLGATLLPTWLEASVDHQELPDEGTGHRSFRATIPAEVLGVLEDGRPPVPAELRLTLDAAGDPVHVEVTTAPQRPPFSLTLDISRIGEPVAITLPATGPAGEAGEAATEDAGSETSTAPDASET